MSEYRINDRVTLTDKGHKMWNVGNESVPFVEGSVTNHHGDTVEVLWDGYAPYGDPADDGVVMYFEEITHA